jgi:nucleoside-diphosphate-sugar epimerase
MNKILIVGGAGYIGGYMTDHLLEKGYNVTVYDSLLFEERYLKNIDFVYGDMRDYDKLQKAIEDKDCVIWLAGLVGDGACAVDPELTQVLNVEAVKWLVDKFKGKVVFPSTCSVYGVNDDLIDEQAEPNPLSVYAHTKLEAERYVVKNCKDYLIFRLGTLFGVGDEHSRLRLDLVVNILSKKASLGEVLTVFGGEQWRPLLHVRDVSTAVEYGLKNNISGVFNLSYKNFKIADLAVEIQKQKNECEIKYTDMKFEDLRNYKVKNDKFLNLGWRPKYDLEYGIKQVMKVIKDGRIKDVDSSVYSNIKYMRDNYGK